MHKLAQSVLGYIRRHDLLRAGDRVGIAVSGGADSVALLRLMLELRDELGVVLSVVHLNHKLRGAESDADEHSVRDLAAEHSLEIVCESNDVKSYSKDKKLSLETAARGVRYQFFECVLQSYVNRIATAHTLDDQAETVLLKLTRGAGTRGLAGIYPKLPISRQPSAFRKAQPERPLHGDASIVRPFLGIERSELRRYLADIGQTWREDATNQDLRHTRNRIRQQVLPILSKELNPSVCNVLSETAEIARGEEEYWAAEVHRLLPEVCHSDERRSSVRCVTLRHLPLALQRRLLRAAVESVGLTLEFHHVEQILGLEEDGDCVVLPGGWLAELRDDEVEFRPSHKATVNDYEYVLPVSGRVALPEVGIDIETIVCSGEEENQKYSPEHLIGREFVGRGLVVRNWRAGERFWPAHTKEPKKIKELLQDRHVIGDIKRLWPVVVSGKEIIWLRGFGIRRDFQASEGRGILIREVSEK